MLTTEPTTAELLAEMRAARDDIHRLTRAISGLAVPVERVRAVDAAKRLGRSVRSLNALCARGIFTDDRGGKAQGSARLFFCDELDAYSAGGRKAVERLRKELGRN